MMDRYWILGVFGMAALTFVSACSDTRRAENVPADTPAATADRAENSPEWARERDEYVSRRERDLDDVDRRWGNYEGKASAKSRSAWNELKEESAGLRRELRELKNASRENWEEAKSKIDSGWERFEAKVRDVFDGDNRPANR